MTEQALPIAKASIEDVIERINSRLEPLKDEDQVFAAMGIDERRPGVGWVELTYEARTSMKMRVYWDVKGAKGYSHVEVECTWKNPMHVEVYDDEWRFPDDEDLEVPQSFVDYVDEVAKKVKEFFEPNNHPEGLWWADENYYLIRPMLEGEDPNVKPRPDVTAVDKDGNVVAESVLPRRALKKGTESALRIHPDSVLEVASIVYARVDEYLAKHKKTKDWENFLDIKGLDPNLCYNWNGVSDKTFQVDVWMSKGNTLGTQLMCWFNNPENVRVEATWYVPESERHATDQYRSDLEAIKEAMIDLATPRNRGDGLWWADENYYPIRPLYVGELPNLKPEPWCTLVDGATGEEVTEKRFYTMGGLRAILNEAIEEARKKSKPDPNVMSAPGVEGVRRHIQKKAESWVNTALPWLGKVLQLDSAHDYDLYIDRDTLWSSEIAIKLYSSYNTSRDILAIHVDISNPLDIDVRLYAGVQAYVNTIMVYDDIAEKEITEGVQEALFPDNDESLWWADENYYPIRPIFVGELGEADEDPPRKGWVVIDSLTGEPVER